MRPNLIMRAVPKYPEKRKAEPLSMLAAVQQVRQMGVHTSRLYVCQDAVCCTEMQFIFDERKAAQAAAFLLKRHGGRLNYMKLIKLLYLADRRALAERGLPITGDRMVSMPKGPVLSGILDLINWGSTDEHSFWLEYISPSDGYDVSVAKSAPDFRSLSRYELKVLEDIDNQFGAMDRWSLVRFTHGLPEWRDPHGSSFPIEPANILRAEDRSEEEIAQIGYDADVALFVEFVRQGSGSDRG